MDGDRDTDYFFTSLLSPWVLKGVSQFFQAVVSGLHVQAPVLTIFIFLFLPDKDTIWQPLYSKRQCGGLWILTTISLLIACLCCYRKRSGRTRTSWIRIAPQNPLETTHVLSSYNFPSLYLSALETLDVEYWIPWESHPNLPIFMLRRIFAPRLSCKIEQNVTSDPLFIHYMSSFGPRKGIPLSSAQKADCPTKSLSVMANQFYVSSQLKPKQRYPSWQCSWSYHLKWKDPP